MHRLIDYLEAAHLSQAKMASELGIARSTMCAICKGHYPVGREKELKEKIVSILSGKGVEVKIEKEQEAVPEEDDDDEEFVKEVVMLTLEAKKQFGLYKDPFVDDVNCQDDVYLTDNVRYVSEYMYMTAKSSGMIAVIGESGSGKSTLRKLLLERIQRDEEKIKIIFPRTLDKSRLTAAAICDAIISDVSGEKPCRSFEAKCRQVEKVLTTSSRAGNNHVLMIEEAHDLDIQTLKYLKRFWELEDGFKKLLSIILIAQPELRPKLDESRNWEAREVIRRMEIVDLAPFISGKEVKEYLEKKIKAAGSSAERIFDPSAYHAFLDALTRVTKTKQVVRSCYPLSVNNLAKKAINKAAELCQPKVTAETIELVK